MTTGRNDPCPCGSGRKYKKCCLVRDEAARETSAVVDAVALEGADLRKAALDALTTYSTREGLGKQARAVFEAFSLDRPLPDGVSEADVHLKFYFHWHFDAILDKGATIAEAFLESDGRSLPTRQRALLERLTRARLRLYEIEEVRRDEGLRLQDLRSGESVWVRERSATRQLERWDVVAARIAEEEDGILGLEGGAYLFPPDAKSGLLERLNKEERKLRRRNDALDDDMLFRRFAPIVHSLWLARAAPRPRPRIVTAEGDDMVFGKCVFDVLDERALRDALDRHAELVAEPDGGYMWVEDSRDGFTRTLGGITVEGGRLTLNVTSRQRAERGRALLANASGAAIRHRATRYESVESVMKTRPTSRAVLPEEEVEIPPAEAARVLAEFKDRHYRTWPDMPLPALGGRTPRHAARLKTVRPRLIDLLKDLENHEARAASPGSPAYDFGWMWRELGLETNSRP
jgi:SEC-C motif-containing protein